MSPARIVTTLRRLLGLTIAPPIRTSMSRTVFRFRPALEALDGRVMPSADFWTGAVSTDAADPLNWSGGLPSAGDTLYFTGPPPGLPGFPPPPPAVNCTGLTGSYGGMFVADSYTATVIFGGTVTVGSFDLAGGAISQPTSGTDLTVTGVFHWTAGTLNSSSHLATVTITGGTAELDFTPTNGGTVDLGSSITLDDGAQATLAEGTMHVTNDGTEININADCGMMADPGTGKITTIKVDTVGVAQINIKTGGSLTVNSGQFGSAANKIPLDNTGGTFTLESGTRAVFGNGDAYHYVQSAGATYIAADATLVAGLFGVKISGGLLSIKAGTQPQNFEGHIKGDLTFQGGDIRFESPTNDTHTFGTFIVNGDVFWEGGTYHPYVDADTDGGSSDVWKATGNFSISATTHVVAVTAVDIENVVVTATSNRSWEVLRSDTSIGAIGGDPSLSSGWTFVKDPADPKEWWKVKKT